MQGMTAITDQGVRYEFLGLLSVEPSTPFDRRLILEKSIQHFTYPDAAVSWILGIAVKRLPRIALQRLPKPRFERLGTPSFHNDPNLIAPEQRAFHKRAVDKYCQGNLQRLKDAERFIRHALIAIVNGNSGKSLAVGCLAVFVN